mgnify:CR=1 FL=1
MKNLFLSIPANDAAYFPIEKKGVYKFSQNVEMFFFFFIIIFLNILYLGFCFMHIIYILTGYSEN